MRPLRVLHLVPSARLGGSERVLLGILQLLDGRSFASYVALPEAGPLMVEIGRTSARCRVIPQLSGISKIGRYSSYADYLLGMAGFFEFLLGAIRLGRWAQEERIDLVHAHGWKAHLLAAVLRPFVDARQIWHVHDFISNRGFHRTYALLASSCADCLIAVSNAVANDLPVGLPIRVIYNGVALDGTESPPPAAPTMSCRLAMIGALAPWKGQDVFLKAVAYMAQEFPSLLAEIVGDEIYSTKGHAGVRRSLEKLSVELDLSTKVRFCGWAKSILPILRRNDLIVHASTEPEPFGRVLIEAMAAGKPVVAINSGGVPEIVQNGVTGILVPAKDPYALARAMGELLKNPDRRRRMGEAGRARVAAQFRIEQQVRSVEEIYRQLANRR